MLSDNQKKALQFIERTLGKEYYGFDFFEASDFIDRYLDKAVAKSQQPTKLQIETAKKICKRCGIKCNAKTKSEYSEFITEHTDFNYIR